jgi:hypothetical protein
MAVRAKRPKFRPLNLHQLIKIYVSRNFLRSFCISAKTLFYHVDPDPHQSDMLDPHPDSHQFADDKLKCTSMEYYPFWHFFNGLSLYLDTRIRIRIRIRVKSRIRIHIKSKSKSGSASGSASGW